MKSSRSASTQNIRRNARRIMSESSDDSESSNTYMDSARAEKIFSRRRNHKHTPDLNTMNDESICIKSDRTLFRVSGTSDSESSQENISMNKTKSRGKSLKNDLLKYRNALKSSDDEQSDNSINNMANKTPESAKSSASSESGEDGILEEFIENNTTNESFLITPNKLKTKPSSMDKTKSRVDTSKNDLLKYKNALKSSDDEQSDNSLNKMSKKTPESEISAASINSGENGIHEKCTEKSASSLENITTNESFFITPKKLTTKPRKILDSSDESEVEETTKKHSIAKETNIILESESDDDIVNSSNEIFPNPVKVNRDRSVIDEMLKDMSLIEPSDSDIDTSAHYKSTIGSSKHPRPFIDDLEYLKTEHTLYKPISQSSVLENSSFEVSLEILNNQEIKNNNEVIVLDDSTSDDIDLKRSTTSKVFPQILNSSIIDLTVNEFDKKTSISLKTNTLDENSRKLSNEYKSLKMEKERLEEVLKRFKKNIDNMKTTMRVTNLHLLPDKGLKLRNAISKEESAYKDTLMQYEHVDRKLKKIPVSFSLEEKPPIMPNNALIKKAASNIDIGAMGQQALSTYRAQQAMTLDVLHSLHKSLETCPDPTILADDPTGLKVELMNHQKYAISWLMWREKQKPHGGILADDMGLGKTLTMISLILKTSEAEKKREYSDTDSNTDSDMNNSLEKSRSNTVKGGTLIICPASLMSQWQNEVKTKLRPRILDVVQHYGPNRESSARRLARKDIVISTYHVVMWDYKSQQKTSPLFQIKWKRIILDEAHTIRNYKSQTSIAVSALHGVNRWALSGTPIHNKEADFFALLKFIKCRPFDDWAVWKRWVGNNDEAGRNRLTLLGKTLMLRRTKVELCKATTFKLPPKTFHDIKVELLKEEKEAYEKVLHFSSTLFATYLYEKAEKENAIERGFAVHNKGKHLHKTNLDDNIFQDHPELDKLFQQLKNNKNIQAHHILVLLLRLRQLCCHPCLMKNMLEDESLKADGIQNTEDLNLVDQMTRMSIGVPSIEKQTLAYSNPIFKDSWVSSKIKAVCDMVEEKVLHTDDKAIIVSQWPSMLILIAKQLAQYKVKTELFSGTVPIVQRNKIVDEFNNQTGKTKIILLSLTAGGVGLNLVAANHLFMVDIHWNPQLEAQACDRIYRVGQKKPVYVYKFICDNTIETSIQSIQNKKLEIANSLFGGCRSIEGSKISLDDLKQIFNINPNQK